MALFYLLLENDKEEHIESFLKLWLSFYSSVTLRNMQNLSLEPPSKNTQNTAIHLIKLVGNRDIQNQYLQISQIYLEKPPLSLRGTLDALEPLYQQKSRLFLYINILRQQHAVIVLFVEIL